VDITKKKNLKKKDFAANYVKGQFYCPPPHHIQPQVEATASYKLKNYNLLLNIYCLQLMFWQLFELMVISDILMAMKAYK
jgi:hypothetical protein